jgi:ubiquinone biosynthesis protein UbiJ
MNEQDKKTLETLGQIGMQKEAEQQRNDVEELKRRLAALERRIEKLEKSQPKIKTIKGI